MKTRISWIFYCLVSFMLLPSLSAAERFVTNESNGFTWIQQGKAYPILVDSQEDKGVLRAVANLQTDAGKVKIVPGSNSWCRQERSQLQI